MCLSRLYTRQGDEGQTFLANGCRVKKSDIRIEACGCLDEVSAHVGLCRCYCDGNIIDELLCFLSHKLLNCISIISLADQKAHHFESLEEDVLFAEEWIDKISDQLEDLKSFILCHGCKLAANLHICRTVMRRAERVISQIPQLNQHDKQVLMFINRASDLLFVLARYANLQKDQKDEEWVVDYKG